MEDRIRSFLWEAGVFRLAGLTLLNFKIKATMQRVKLRLKNKYSYGDKGATNDYGFVRTSVRLPIGTKIKFQELMPQSWVGDLNTDHYQFFAGRIFKSVTPSYPAIQVELQEI